MRKILSISIASYNVEKYLKNTLESLLCDKETLNKIEVIIVNDGSKDKTITVADEYCNKYPESFVLIDKENGGYGSTINAALRIATGKYFRLLDGDDWYVTNHLKEYIQFLEATETDMIISPYIEYREDLKTEKLLDRHNLDSYRIYHLADLDSTNLNDIKMHELAAKTDMLKKGALKITENCFYTDTEYVFQVFMLSNSVEKYDAPIYKYRIGSEGQSVSVLGRLKHFKDAETVLDKILTLYEKKEASLPIMKKKVLWNTVKVVAMFQYTTYLLFESSKASKIQLKKYDKKLKDVCEPLYKDLGNESKIVTLLRVTDYMIYSMARKRIMDRL